MINLRVARNENKLDQFVAEREADPQGDQEAFDATLKAMAETSKSAPETSKRRRSAD